MCNEYQTRFSRELVGGEFRQIKIPFTWADPEPNRPIDRPVKPTNRATIIRPINPDDPMAGVEGLDVRWWMIPFFHRKPVKEWKAMCINARLETLDTTAAFREAYKRRRCLVPVTSFIEYDEPPGWKKGAPKRRWDISWPGGGVRYFAGLWDRATPTDQPDGLESFAFVTGAAGPDFSTPRPDTGKPLHERQARVLTLAEGMEWLRLDGPGKALLEDPGPAGSLVFTERPRELDAA